MSQLETDFYYMSVQMREIKASQDRQNRILVGILVTLIGVAGTYLLQILTTQNPPTG